MCAPIVPDDLAIACYTVFQIMSLKENTIQYKKSGVGVKYLPIGTIL